MDTWVIGDVHGCLKEAERLVEIITDLSENKPKLIFCGDIVDRGPAKLIDLAKFIKNHNGKMLYGNHEFNLYRELFLGKECRSQARALTIAEYNSYSVRDQDYIREYLLCDEMRYYHIENNHLICHSIPKKVGFDIEQTLLLNKNKISNFIFRGDTLTEEEYNLMYDYKIVHGHQSWNFDKLFSSKKVINLDSGCVYGGELTAYNIYNNITCSVKSSFNHEK